MQEPWIGLTKLPRPRRGSFWRMWLQCWAMKTNRSHETGHGMNNAEAMNWFDEGWQVHTELLGSEQSGFSVELGKKIKSWNQATGWIPQTAGKQFLVRNGWMSPACPHRVQQAECKQQVLEAVQTGFRVPQQLRFWDCYVWTKPNKLWLIKSVKLEKGGQITWIIVGQGLTHHSSTAGRRLSCFMFP